ncbi:MAG: hypothetical protein PHO66_01290 [Eubacteriales bacterium]|nr:hypothetical protein [Eubacteriales bacterium]
MLGANPTEKVRHTTRAALCFIHKKTGDTDKAVAAAQNLPHLRESREEVLAQLEKATTHRQIDACLRALALGTDGEPRHSAAARHA